MSQLALSEDSAPEALAARDARATVPSESPSDGDIRIRAAPRSRHILALTGLRGYAALWVVLSHVSFTDQFLWQLGARVHWHYLDGVIRHEYLAVDLFFMLSGFVLTHVHGAELDDNISRRVYGRFLLLRLARVYPLHMVGLLLTAATHAFSAFDVYPNDTLFAFLTQVFLVSSWGFTSGINWNLPAWSLSSEWMAYLVFPSIALATAACRKVRWQLLAIAALGLCFDALIFCSPVHLDYSSGAGAAIRVLAGAAIGSLLRRLYDSPGLQRVPWAFLFWLTVPLAASTMTTLDGARRPDSIWAWLAMPVLLFTAARARSWSMFPFTSRLAVYLGEISFAVYIVHHPVLRALRVLFRPQLETAAATTSDGAVLAIIVGVLLVIIVVAALAHAFIEVPVRNWARRGIDR